MEKQKNFPMDKDGYTKWKEKMGKKDTCERDLNSSVLSEMWCVRFGSVQLLSRVQLFAAP